MPNPSLGNLEDVRQLRAVLDDLQKRMTKLEGTSVPFATNQRGALPGYMRAVQINDVAQKSSMWMKLDGNQPGQAPYQAVTDAAGTIRVELGFLAALGVSSQHYGWRVNDANHVPIADAIGLSQVMSSLGVGSNTSLISFTNTTPQVITNLTVTFSLVRTARVLIVTNVVGNATTQSGFVDIDVDGVILIQGTANGYQWGISGPSTCESLTASTSLAAGSHTIDLRAYVAAAGGTFTFLGGRIEIFLLGT